jgi:RNA polymerase sigma-70 factor (ECF subfamily)
VWRRSHERGCGQPFERTARRPAAKRKDALSEQDERIAGRIRRGEEQAFDAFFDRFGAPLLGYLAGMLGGRAAAEDALQETVLRIHRKIDRYEERGTFKAWVYRIATNVALSELRRSRYASECPEDEAAHVPDPAWVDPLLHLEEEEREKAVRGAMKWIPDDQRAVLLLRVRDGMGIEEIARVLCVPEGTVKSRIHYGVRKLRALLEQRDPGKAGAVEAANHDDV